MPSCTKSSKSGTENVRRLVRLPVVLFKTGKSRSTLYREMASGTFPKPVKIGEKSIAWVESEVDDWVAARVVERDRSST